MSDEKTKDKIAIVVAYDNSADGGILSAKSFENGTEMLAWQMDELLRLYDDYNEKPVTISMYRDTYDEWIMHASYGDNQELEYKLFWQETEEI